MTVESHPYVMQKYLEMCQQAKMNPLPPVYIYEDDKPGASCYLKEEENESQGIKGSVTARIQKIEISTSLLNLLNERETVAILAHEMGHALHEAVPRDYSVGDVVKGFSGGAAVSYIITKILNNEVSSRRQFLSDMRSTISMGLSSGVFINFFSFLRNAEESQRRSDAVGVRLTEDVEAMISALTKIRDWETENEPVFRDRQLDERIGLLKKMAETFQSRSSGVQVR